MKNNLAVLAGFSDNGLCKLTTGLDLSMTMNITYIILFGDFSDSDNATAAIFSFLCTVVHNQLNFIALRLYVGTLREYLLSRQLLSRLKTPNAEFLPSGLD